MNGQRIGYIRVSTLDQNTSRQLEGIATDRTYVEKISAKDTNRPELQALLNYAREGDVVIVHSMDRLARNLEDLRSLVRQFTDKKVQVRFIKEGLIFNGDDSAMATLMLSVMGAFAEFERALLKERQREGIELAKKRGAYKGSKKCLTTEQVLAIQEGIKAGVAKARLARNFGISRETLYRYMQLDQG